MNSTLRKLAVIFAASSALAGPAAMASQHDLTSPLNPMSPNYILKSGHSMLDSGKHTVAVQEKPKPLSAEHQVILDQYLTDASKTPDDLLPHLPPSYSTDVESNEVKYLNGCRDDMKLANTYNAAAIKTCMRNEWQSHAKLYAYSAIPLALLIAGGLAYTATSAASRDAKKYNAQRYG